MLTSILSSIRNRLFPAPRKGPAATSRRHCRPKIEVLEERQLLAADSLGTDFWMTFMQNAGNPTTLELYIASDTNTTATVSVPSRSWTMTVPVQANQITTVPFPAGGVVGVTDVVVAATDTIESKAIHITSASEVSVYGLNHQDPTSDAFLALPTDVLGTEYITMGWRNNSGASSGQVGSEFAIVATVDNSTVNITPTADTNGHTAGVQYSITLNQGQTYFLRNDVTTQDLTGTIITSDQRIAVFSGNRRTQLPTASFSAGNHLVEQLTPTVTWGKNFVTYPLRRPGASSVRGDSFRVLASTDNTQVNVNGSVVATLNRGQFYEAQIIGASVITATNPVLVAQFSHSQSYDGSTVADPFMVLIPPAEQFLADYTITTPSSLSFPQNFINVVAPTSALGSITLNGVPIDPAIFTPIGSTTFSGTQIPVNAGVYNLSGPQAFGVYVYAYANIDGFGYVGGMSMASVALASSLTLTPPTASQAAGGQQTMVGTVRDILNNPLEGIRVDFAVTGANPINGFAFTDASGQATFTYTGASAGNDVVTATQGSLVDTSQITWTTGVTVSPTTLDLDEGGTAQSYTVSLRTQPDSNVTITASASSRLTLSQSVLVFTPTNWATKIVQVTANENLVAEGPIVDLIQHTATGDPNFTFGSVDSVTVNITDNDLPGVTPAPGVYVLEGQSRSYKVVLESQPTDFVTVTLTPDPELSLSTTTLVFGPGDWNVAQSVNVTANDNALVDPNRSVAIQQALSSGDPFYDGLAIPDQAVTIINDDNVLFVNGTGSADQLAVLFSANLIQVVLNKKASFHPTTYSQVVIQTGDGSDSIILANPSIPVALLAGTGTDKVQIDGQSGANDFTVDGGNITINTRDVLLGDAESALLNGKNSSDLFTILNAPSFALTVQGAGGMDRLVGADQDSTWKITGANAGAINTSIAWNGVEHLVGGSADDQFVFSATRAISGQVDGGGGNNTLDFSAYKSPITANLQTNTITGTKGFLNIASLVGGSGLDKLIGANASNAWNITGPNAGDVGSMNFAGFENLTGGALDDTFAFADGQWIKGKIDGGAGSDILDYSGFLAAGITINLQGKSATGTGGWLNFEQFVGGAGTDRLIGANRTSTWSLTGQGLGTITGGVNFQGFENLTGGSLVDTFDLSGGGDWLGLLDGASGNDTMVAPTGGTYVLTGVNTGTMNGRNFKAVEVRR